MALIALTPWQGGGRLSPQDAEAALARYDVANLARQLGAIAGHDIYRVPAASSEKAAAGAIGAKLLIVVSSNDLLVNPEPSLALAAALKAETLVLESPCGHFSILCEGEKITRAVSAFLNRRD